MSPLFLFLLLFLDLIHFSVGKRNRNIPNFHNFTPINKETIKGVTFFWNYPLGEDRLFENVLIHYYCKVSNPMCPHAAIQGTNMTRIDTKAGTITLVCTYLCHGGEPEFDYIQLTVKGRELIQNKLRIETNMRRPMNVSIGNDLVLTCACSSDYNATVKWYNENEDLNYRRVQFNDSHYIVNSVQLIDAGDYGCECSNFVESDSVLTYVSVVTDEDINSEDDDIAIGYLIISAIFAVIFTLIVFISVLCIKLRTRKKKTEYLMNQLKKLYQDLNSDEVTDNISEKSVDSGENSSLLSLLNKKYDRKWEIKREELIFGQLIGKGFFANVVQGSYKNNKVAIKTLKNSLNVEHVKSLISELKIMSNLGSHPNIVSLIGACTKNLMRGELLIVVEYCELGNLERFLIQSRPHYEPSDVANLNSRIVSRSHLISFCRQIASGMEYLSNKNVIQLFP